MKRSMVTRVVVAALGDDDGNSQEFSNTVSRRLFSGALFACITLTSACGSGGPLDPSLNTVHGQVISDDFYLAAGESRFEPVAGVRVEVMDGPEKGRVSITNAEGKYDLGSLTTNARILATKDGWEPAYWMRLSEPLWVTLSQAPHVMWGSVSLSGTSTKLEGVRIRILQGPNVGKVTETDSTGNYRFGDLVTSAPFNVEFSKTGYTTRQITIDPMSTSSCEWGTVRCGLRGNYGQDSSLAVSSDPQR